jgi:hypothetical protein
VFDAGPMVATILVLFDGSTIWFTE